MKRPTSSPLALAAALLLAFTTMAGAVAVVGTDFAGRVVTNNTTALIHDYTLNGIANPGPITVSQVPGGPTVQYLYDTPDAQGHFAPRTSINATRWMADVPMAIGAVPIDLENIVLDVQCFNGSGLKKSPPTSTGTQHYISLYVYDGSGSVVAQEQIASIDPHAIYTNTYYGFYGVNLAANSIYTLRIIVSGPTTNDNAVAGSFVGLNAITVNGTLANVTPVQLAITAVNGGVDPTAGASYSVTVESQDINGNPQNLSANTGVTLSLGSGTAGSLGGNLTGTILTGTSSVIISGVTNRVAEPVTLVASTNSGTSLTAGSTSYSIIPGAAVALAVTGFPNPAATGLVGSLTVAAVDAHGNTDFNYLGTIQITSSDGAATFSANPYTFVAEDAGAKTFNATLNTVGTQSITATDTVTSSITGTQSGISVITLATAPTAFDWTNTVSGNWAAAANWTNDVGAVLAPPAPGETNYVISFNQAGTYTANQNLNSGFLLNQLNFGGPDLTLTGNRLTFINDVATQPQISQNSAATVTVSTPLELGADTTIGGTGNGDVNFQGEISGVGSLIKDGPSAVTLTASNTYTGGTLISDGTVVLIDRTGLSTGPVTNNATLTMATAQQTGVYGAIYAAFPLVGSGTNNVINGATGRADTFLGDCSSFTGVWNIGYPTSGGGSRFFLKGGDNPAALYNLLPDATLMINSSSINYGTLYLYGSILNPAGATGWGQLQSLDSNVQWAGSVILAGSAGVANHLGCYQNASYSLTVSGPIGEINGSQSLRVGGYGKVLLSGTNTFTGETKVSVTTLVLSNQLALQYSTLNKTVASGSVQFGSGIGSFTLGGLAGTQPIALDDQAFAPVALTVGGNNQDTTCSGVLSGGGSLTKVGNGTLRLTAANTYSGLTTVSNGSLYVSTALQSFGSVAVADGAKFGVINTVSSQAAILSNLTLGSSGPTTLSFSNVSDTTTELLTTYGTVALNGNCTIAIDDKVNLVAGNTYPLIYSYSPIVTNSASGFGLMLPSGVSGYLTNDAVGRISLFVQSLINTNPPSLISSYDGARLIMDWPTNAGWILQVQTNGPDIGLSTNWTDVPGSDAVTSATNMVDPANGSVFYRLRLP